MCQMGQVTGSVLSPTVLHIYIACIAVINSP